MPTLSEVPPLIQAPADPSLWTAWRDSLAQWRNTARSASQPVDDLYSRPEFSWAASTYAFGLVMLWDEAFYDRTQGRYCVERFVEDGRREFGGYDAVVLWHAYPNIGFDGKNQFDFYRNMPGGIAGLRELSRDFHARGIKVFVDYNPWDIGTRREPQPDADALAEMVADIEADGIFLDTMACAAAEFRQKIDARRPGVVLESEMALPVAGIADHHMSWAQGFEEKFKDSHVPGVLRNRWFERRHMMHLIRRYEHDHTGEMHAAWMNGAGILIWENVFGSWNGWNARDKSIARAMLPIQRRHTKWFTGEGWTPLVETTMTDVFASLWEHSGVRLWTLVNRSEQPSRGPLLNLSPGSREKCFDLIRGCETGDRPAVEIPPRGIACFVTGEPSALGADFPVFLQRQAEIHARSHFDTTVPRRRIVLQARPVSPPVSADRIPPGMVTFAATSYCCQATYRRRECGFYEPLDLADLAIHVPGHVEQTVELGAFAMDRLPVTNRQFQEFLQASGYKPACRENFLRHWEVGTPPAEQADDPVVYVDLEDARAYARFVGKRLPTEWEWQYACESGKLEGGLKRVWNWTESERADGRTRFCILKGGSWFAACGSDWYADGGPRPCSFGVKYILMWPGQDRLSTIGFRCVVDVKT